jgi:hypothetical protein
MIDYAAAILDCALARWSPRIGDPSVMGWLTVGCYAGAALLCAATAWAGHFPDARRRVERAWWVALALGLAALAVNKQLDLQSALTAVGRCVAQAGGWYAERRAAQVGFIAAVAALVLVAALAAAALLRRSLARVWLSLAGAAVLAAFVMIRAVGFHHIDGLIGTEVAGWRLNWVFELGGIALVGLGALWALAVGPRPAAAAR